MKDHRCMQCRLIIPVFKKDYVFSDGNVIRRAGERSGSEWMRRVDKDMHFCSMRCAALFGIACAINRSRAKP